MYSLGSTEEISLKEKIEDTCGLYTTKGFRAGVGEVTNHRMEWKVMEGKKLWRSKRDNEQVSNRVIESDDEEM